MGAAGGIQGVQVVSGIIAARVLGPTDRGFLALLTVIPSSICQVGAVGISLALTYYLSRGRESGKALVALVRRTATTQIVALTVVHAGVLVFVLTGERNAVIVAGLLTLVSVPVSFMNEYGRATVLGLGRFQLANGLQLLNPLAYAVALAVVVLAGGAGLVLVVTLNLVTNALGAAAMVVAAARTLRERDAPTDVTPGEVHRFGVRAFAGYFSPLEAFRLDQLLVAALLSPTALGLYVAGAAFANVPRVFGSAVGLIAAPAVSEEVERAAQWRRMVRFAVVTGVVTAAVSLPLAALMGWLVPTLFGDEFAGGVGVGRWLLVSSTALAVRRVLANAGRGLGRPGIGAPSEMLSTVVFVVSIVALGDGLTLDAVGACFTVANVMGLLLLVYRLRRTWRKERIEC